MNNLFVIGNGESRKNISIKKLQALGRVWGCNAMYREYNLDGLIAVDPMLEHEIYRSGYTHNNPVYFRDWDPMPTEHYDMMKDAFVSKMTNPKIREHGEKKDNFVIHGQSAVNQSRTTERWKGEGFENVYITWTHGSDKVTQLKDIMTNIDGEPQDLGWCSGASAMYVACKVEQPKQCYMVGMDLYSTNNKTNNLYKDTFGYVSANETALNPENWVIQKGRCMMQNPNIEFIKVNGEGFDELPEWKSISNLSYMSVKEFEKKFN